MQIETVDNQEQKLANNRVKVAIRVRPFIERERILRDGSCVKYLNDKQLILANEKNFRFDRVFKEMSEQREVYDQCVKGLVDRCFEGYNAAVLAYGQTGSGKTYTMGTGSTKIAHEEIGIVPRVIQNIFSEAQKRSQTRKFVIKATFLEIYNQQIIDLLADDHHNKNMKQFCVTQFLHRNRQNPLIAIRQEKDGSVGIYGATQEELTSPEQTMQLLQKGSFHRTTASTMMNEGSSRSHAIFTISIEQHSACLTNEIVDENYMTAKFVFVDLAGSERAKKTGATGATLKQGININLGLLQLGNVISSLAVEKKQPQYINYRNSKLTRILQDSLGGNSNTYMIACISPADSNYEESLNTIKYASKAMNIKNKPVVNRDPQLVHILALKARIQELQNENRQLKSVLNEKGIQYQIIQPKASSASNNYQHLNSFGALSGSLSNLNNTSNSISNYSSGEQVSRLKLRNAILDRKCQHLMIESKQQKKRCNDMQIQLYELKRDRDVMKMRVQLLSRQKQARVSSEGVQACQNSSNSVSSSHHHNHEDFNSEQEKIIPLIENYLNKIQELQSDIHQKDKLTSQLQIEYSRLYDLSERDSKLLVKKNAQIMNLQRQIRKLRKENKQAMASSSTSSLSISNNSQAQSQKQTEQIINNAENNKNIENEKPDENLKNNSSDILINRVSLYQQNQQRHISGKGVLSNEDCPQQNLEDISDEDDLQELSQIQYENQLENDDEFRSQASNHEGHQSQLNTELKQVENRIRERENYMNQVTNDQVELEYRLIQEMKEQYHQKINEIQREKAILLRQQKAQLGGGGGGLSNKFTKNKIDSLENQLKDLKKKAKEQKNLERQVSTQNGRLKNLSNQINQFKLQKIQLNRKMKEDKEKFGKFKIKRTKQLIAVRRENSKKDSQIRKLKNQNKKFAQQALKKKDEIKRVKKANQTLKGLMQPRKISKVTLNNDPSLSTLPNKFFIPSSSSQKLSKNTPRCSSRSDKSSHQSHLQPQRQNSGHNIPSDEKLSELITNSLREIVVRIDRDMDIEQLTSKCEEIEAQVELLRKEQSELNLQIERLRLREQDRELLQQSWKNYSQLQKIQQEREQLADLQVKSNEIAERRINLQEDLDFRQKKYQDLFQDSQRKYAFDYETEIVYNTKFQSIECMRAILIHVYQSVVKILTENINIKFQNTRLSHHRNNLIEQVDSLKQMNLNLKTQHQSKISKLREQMAREYYQDLQAQSRVNLQNSNLHQNCPGSHHYSYNRHDIEGCPFTNNNNRSNLDEMKKKHEKKVEQINKINRTLTKEIQILRKRNATLSDKYNNLKSLFNKDKFIGVSPSTSSLDDFRGVDNYMRQGGTSLTKRHPPTNSSNAGSSSSHLNNSNVILSNSKSLNSTAAYGSQQMLPSISQESYSMSKSHGHSGVKIESSSQDSISIQQNHQQYKRKNFGTLPPQHSRNHQQHSSSIKRSHTDFEHSNQQQSSGGLFNRPSSLSKMQFSRNTWQLGAQIQKANNNSPILSIASQQNILVSTANRSIAIWDIECNALIKDINFGSQGSGLGVGSIMSNGSGSGNNFTSGTNSAISNNSSFNSLSTTTNTSMNSTVVKSSVIHPNGHIMFTASDKNITVWDMRTFTAEMVLKGHKDEIRTMHLVESDDNLYSAGKGTMNGGSLLAWDLRNGGLSPVAEKQRNQDILSMTSHNGILYYGARNHYVKRMKIPTNQLMTAFQPPHMDTVTGLAILGEYLVSGSKDKNLRLWSLDTELYNLKSTVPSFNEYITALESMLFFVDNLGDNDLPLFYVSDRSGQVKIGSIYKEKIEFVGGILAHSQQINAICKIKSSSYRGVFATASSDRSIKIWRPSHQTLNHILSDFAWDC